MGAAIAELLAARGAYVVVTARHREDSEPPTSLIQADLASPEGADFVAGEAIRILGGLDIVVHCVGASFSKPGGVLALTEDDWRQALGTNLLSAVRLDRAVLPGMLEQRRAPSCTSPRCNGSVLIRPRQRTDLPRQR